MTPADMHRRNVAEQAIQTYKGHFISVLAGVSDNFPIHHWDELIPQTVLTLKFNTVPNVSVYAYHHGPFDYNRMPFAPMGCAVQFHIKPSRRKTWGEHSSDGWYLRTSPEHYRSHIVLVKATRAKRITDTVFFKHKFITQPTVTPVDAIIKACQDLKLALQGKSNIKGNVQMDAIKQIEQALEQNYEVPLDHSAERQPRVEPEQKKLPKPNLQGWRHKHHLQGWSRRSRRAR